MAIENDAELERAILRLRGEWQEYSGGKIETFLFEVTDDRESLIESTEQADLVVFASRRLGELCESKAIRPVRPSILKSELLRFNDFMPLVRNQEITYGKQTMALPLGCPTPLLAQPSSYNSDKEPMRLALTSDVAASLSRSEAIELGITYLAWTAPSVVHRGSEANLFEPGLGKESFIARIAAPPFVRSLGRFKEATQFIGKPNAKVIWPNRSSKAPQDDANELGERPLYAEVAPLGSAIENYNRLAEEWEPLSERERHATLLASSGRLIAVTSSSRNAATAFRYAAWLVSPSNSRLLSTASDNVVNVRGSLARTADNWVLGEDPSLGRNVAETLTNSLRERRYLLVPRIPASDRYLEALGRTVQQTLNDELSPELALEQGAADWDAISAEVGLLKQRAAYLRSIGSTDYEP